MNGWLILGEDKKMGKFAIIELQWPPRNKTKMYCLGLQKTVHGIADLLGFFRFFFCKLAYFGIN